jgi:MazG family protein
MNAGEEFVRLADIMHRLRRDCPWDRQQTRQSLRPYLLEEAYEVLHALDNGLTAELCEELGDLMLQILFHAEIASERHEFDIAHVLHGINQKLVRRHPHVFGDHQAETADDVLRRWEEIKTGQEQKASALDGVPEHLPALLRAARVLAKVKQVGLDPFGERDAAHEAACWLGELSDAVARSQTQRAAKAAGMVCLLAAELASRAMADAEDALRETVARLADAFQREEARLKEQGLRLADLPAEERSRIAARLLSSGEGG